MSITRVGPTLPITDLQVAIDNLDTLLASAPFTEDHFIEVQEGSTADNIEIPSTLVPTSTFKLYISGEFRDRPLVQGDGTAGVWVRTPHVVLRDLEIVGKIGSTYASTGAVAVDANCDEFTLLRSIVHDGNYLVKFADVCTDTSVLINNDFHSFIEDGVFKEGGELILKNNSGLNYDTSSTTHAMVHVKDMADFTMHRNSWYVHGDNAEHFCIYMEESNPPYATLDFSTNNYYPGSRTLDSFAKISRRDIITTIIDHALVQDIASSDVFTDSDATFISSGVQVGDVLTFETNAGDLVDGGSIVSSANTAEYTIIAVLSQTQLQLHISTTAEIGQFEYTIVNIMAQETDYDQISNWASLTGETGAQVRDPDYASVDLEEIDPISLYPGCFSPLLQQGAPDPDVENDIDGNIRPADLISVGSHEFRGVYTYSGVSRILELIGGLSTMAASKFAVGNGGAYSLDTFYPEAPAQGNTGLDSPLGFTPFSERTVSGGLLTLVGIFNWRYLLPDDHCDLTEIHDQVIDTFSEVGVVTDDGVLLFRLTTPELPVDILSPLSPKVTFRLRFEGKVIQQEFQGGVGYRLPNSDDDLPFVDWEMDVEIA